MMEQVQQKVDPEVEELSEDTTELDRGGANKNEEPDTQQDHDNFGAEEAKKSLTSYQLARDRPRRTVVPPLRYNDYDCTEEEVAFSLVCAELMYAEEPRNYTEAKASKDWDKWNASTDEEVDSLQKNGTWVMVKKPKDRKIISNKWIFKIKPGI